MKKLSEQELRAFHRRLWKYIGIILMPIVIPWYLIPIHDLGIERTSALRTILTALFLVSWAFAVYISSWYFRKCPACGQQLPTLNPGRCPACFVWLSETPETQLPNSADIAKEEAISKSSIPRRLKASSSLYYTFTMFTVLIFLWISMLHLRPVGMTSFALALLVGSTGLLIVILYLARRKTLRIMREGKLVQAEVTEILKTLYSNQAYVKYLVDGTIISTKGGISASSTLKTGDKVMIFIDPKDPAKIVIASDAPYRVV